MSIDPRGGGVRVVIADSRKGIAPNRSRKFSCRFATKPPGQGTGMGLSIVHLIIERHGGTITVASEPDKGNRVHDHVAGRDRRSFNTKGVDDGGKVDFHH